MQNQQPAVTVRGNPTSRSYIHTHRNTLCPYAVTVGSGGEGGESERERETEEISDVHIAEMREGRVSDQPIYWCMIENCVSNFANSPNDS